MIDFPPAVLEKVCQNWDLENILTITRTSNGNVNKNWIIETEDSKYILKEIYEGSDANLEFEFSYLHFLQSKGFPYQIPKPVGSSKGLYYLQDQGTYYWLYNYINGSTVSKIDESELLEIAKMVSSYHLILEHSPYSSGVFNEERYNPWIAEELASYINDLDNLETINDEDRILQTYGSKLLNLAQEVSMVTAKGLRTYALHRDLGGDNLIWQGNKLTGVLDFENVGMYKEPFVKDLAVIILYSCRIDGSNIQTNLKKVKLLLDSYNTTRKLAREELVQLPNFLLHGQIEDFNYAYWLIKHRPEKGNLERLERYAKSVLWHYEHKGSIIDELIRGGEGKGNT